MVWTMPCSTSPSTQARTAPRKYLQAACGPAIAQDGKIGPSTIAAVKAKPAGVLIDTICDARLAFLDRLPTWPKFGKGGARALPVCAAMR
jgi:lysozyme family protein